MANTVFKIFEIKTNLMLKNLLNTIYTSDTL